LTQNTIFSNLAFGHADSFVFTGPRLEQSTLEALALAPKGDRYLKTWTSEAKTFYVAGNHKPTGM